MTLFCSSVSFSILQIKSQVQENLTFAYSATLLNKDLSFFFLSFFVCLLYFVNNHISSVGQGKQGDKQIFLSPSQLYFYLSGRLPLDPSLPSLSGQVPAQHAVRHTGTGQCAPHSKPTTKGPSTTTPTITSHTRTMSTKYHSCVPPPSQAQGLYSRCIYQFISLVLFLHMSSAATILFPGYRYFIYLYCCFIH